MLIHLWAHIGGQNGCQITAFSGGIGNAGAAFVELIGKLSLT